MIFEGTGRNINTGVPQGSIQLFLIYIKDLAVELSSNTKLFADDTFLFSGVHNKDSSSAELSNDLAKISHWAQQGKISFNPYPRKQAQEVIYSRKVNKDSHPSYPPLTFNNNIVYRTTSQNHLGIILDNGL